MSKEEDTWRLEEVEVLIVVIAVVISKYWTIYLHQGILVKFSLCEGFKLKKNNLHDI